jgi:Protein of unknown function (DUF2892).
MKEKIVRRVAGGIVLISILLGYLENMHWLWLTAFVGINLIQSSFTGFCPLEKLLEIKFSRSAKG